MHTDKERSKLYSISAAADRLTCLFTDGYLALCRDQRVVYVSESNRINRTTGRPVGTTGTYYRPHRSI
jgi:hypothetical protein